jgi:hypothetical protein
MGSQLPVAKAGDGRRVQGATFAELARNYNVHLSTISRLTGV